MIVFIIVNSQCLTIMIALLSLLPKPTLYVTSSSKLQHIPAYSIHTRIYICSMYNVNVNSTVLFCIMYFIRNSDIVQ